MITRLLTLLLLALALWAQNPNTAKYPSALPTDTDLLVAKNRLDAALTLSSTIDASTLTVPVNDGSLVPIPGVIRIDYELLKICSRTGNTLTVCSGGRGFDSSVAQSHSSGATISNVISAWYHNQVAAEIIAIATRLGTGFNGQAISTTQITSGQLALARGGTGADLSATGGSGYVLKQSSVGAGVTVAALVAGDIPSLVGASKLSDYSTAFVTSITGTANQVIRSASVGGVTLSLPQDIHTAATPTFGGLTSPSLTYAGTLALSATGANPITFSANGGERARVTSGGNFAVGTTSASYRTVIRGNDYGASFDGLVIEDVAAERVRIGYTSTNIAGSKLIPVQIAWSAAAGGASGDLLIGSRGTVTSSIAFFTSPDAGTTGLVERARITSGGNVLVGTTTDDGSSKLQVAGNTLITGVLKTQNTGVGNSSRPAITEAWASSAAVPGTYSRLGGYLADFSAGAKSDFGLFSDGVTLSLQTIGAYGINLMPNSTRMASLSSAGTFTLYNETATTGSTSFVVRAGAGQSTNALTTWQNNAGTTIAYVGSDGSLVSSAVYVNTAAASTTSLNLTDNANYTLRAGYTASGAAFFGGLAGTSLVLKGSNTEVIRLAENAVGFFGVTPVAKQSASDLAGVIAALKLYGLLAP